LSSFPIFIHVPPGGRQESQFLQQRGM
jgi:hypothetical protein